MQKSMSTESFRMWIHQIYATRDDELDCEEFSKTVAQYVDAELAGEEAHLRFPGVRRHLDQCQECADLYLAMCDAALLENQQVVPLLMELSRA
jgi:hypothetical protein